MKPNARTLERSNNMKTILVIFTDSPLHADKWPEHKHYSFNTNDEVSVGDHFRITNYKTPIQVIDVLPDVFTYVDVKTGELSNDEKKGTFKLRLAQRYATN